MHPFASLSGHQPEIRRERGSQCFSMSDHRSRLKQQYVGKRVVVDAHRPELARLADMPGRVIAINHNDFALVQFEGPDPSWHDIAPQFLKLEPSP